MSKTELQSLAAKLEEQCAEMEKTVEALTAAARESNSHEFKFRMLTEISSGHFGLGGLPTKVEKLKECVDALKKEDFKE